MCSKLGCVCTGSQFFVLSIEEFLESKESIGWESRDFRFGFEAKKAAAAAAYQEELRMRAKEAAERREKAGVGSGPRELLISRNTTRNTLNSPQFQNHLKMVTSIWKPNDI